VDDKRLRRVRSGEPQINVPLPRKGKFEKTRITDEESVVEVRTPGLGNEGFRLGASRQSRASRLRYAAAPAPNLLFLTNLTPSTTVAMSLFVRDLLDPRALM